MVGVLKRRFTELDQDRLRRYTMCDRGGVSAHTISSSLKHFVVPSMCCPFPKAFCKEGCRRRDNPFHGHGLSLQVVPKSKFSHWSSHLRRSAQETWHDPEPHAISTRSPGNALALSDYFRIIIPLVV